MANYTYYSRVFYAGDGSRTAEANFPGGSNYSSTDIDDGFWNVGDARVTTGNFDYAGYLDHGGIRILFFTHSNPSIGTYAVSLSQATAPGFPEYPATYQPGDFTLNTTALATCFAEGTEIATPEGVCAVEQLSRGDRVLTAAGKAVEVLWVGRQALHPRLFGSHVQPVRIRAGALGDGLPSKDLIVTADHGMVLEDYVVNASALVNGTTIDWVPLAELEDSFTVYHVETEAHDVILANGAASETFVDAVTRSRFDNHADYLDLYGADRIVPEMPRQRITSSRLLPRALRDRLAPPNHGTKRSA